MSTRKKVEKRTGPKKPSFIRKDHLTYLDGLRESGVTNMMGAGRYIESTFGVDRDKARRILAYWMDTYSIRHP